MMKKVSMNRKSSPDVSGGTFWIYTIVWLIFLFFLSRSVPAYYGDLPKEHTAVSLGVAGQNTNQVTSLTAVYPLNRANGWMGVYVSRQVADSMVTSEILNGHVQGGVSISKFKIEAYVAATRDKWRAIDFAIESGYFIRPGAYRWRGILFSGGAGNYTERRDVDEGIGRAKEDASTTFGWLCFVSGKWRNVSGVLRYKPSIDFDRTTIEGSLSFNHQLSESLAIGITTQSVFDSASIVDSDVHSSYLIQFTYTPE